MDTYVQIGILSDTHGALETTRRAVDTLRGAGVEALIHCGDLNTREIVEACSVLPFYFVFGNHDSDMVSQLREAALEFDATCLQWGGEIELAGRRIAVCHGHLKTDREPLQQRAPDYLLTGHTHEKADWREGPVRRINPGALFRAARYWVAVLDLETDEVQFIEIPKSA